eukprot:15380605-Alexandrium_andersonii.AAC.1
MCSLSGGGGIAPRTPQKAPPDPAPEALLGVVCGGGSPPPPKRERKKPFKARQKRLKRLSA